MKYISNRKQFLNDFKAVKIEDIKINESVDMMGAGPFSNDTPWGDTLVGRLINHIRRKIGIGVNMVRIQPIIRRLKIEFDNIIEYSAIGELSEEDKKKIALIIVCQLVRYIKLAIVDKSSIGTNEDLEELPDDSEMTPIKDENYLNEIDSIITDVMQQIGEVSDQFGEIESENEIINALRELQKKVKELKSKLKTEEKGEEKGEGNTAPAPAPERGKSKSQD